jgi:hypothetical protein
MMTRASDDERARDSDMDGSTKANEGAVGIVLSLDAMHGRCVVVLMSQKRWHVKYMLLHLLDAQKL